MYLAITFLQPKGKVQGSKETKGFNAQVLLAESEPVAGVDEAADPAQARLALRVIPPDIARVAVAPEGAFRRCNHIHRVLTEGVVEGRVLFADSEDFARVGVLQHRVFPPRDRLVPVAVAFGVVQEDDVLLDHRLGNGLVLSADFGFPNVVVIRGVRTRKVHGFLPFAILLDADTAEHVDACADRCRLFGEFGDAFIAERSVSGLLISLERVKVT